MLSIKNTSNNEVLYSTNDSAGFDIPSNENGFLEPGEYKLFKTGLFLNLDDQKADDTIRDVLYIMPRSGLALKFGITVLNSPGVIDSKYPGEIGVILINHGKARFEVKIGDRIAQGVLSDVLVSYGDIKHKADVRLGGFGSTNEVKS